MKTITLSTALMSWATEANLETGLATAKNPLWREQARDLLLKSEWERIKPLLQRVVDDNQALLQKLHYGESNAPTPR